MASKRPRSLTENLPPLEVLLSGRSAPNTATVPSSAGPALSSDLSLTTRLKELLLPTAAEVQKSFITEHLQLISKRRSLDTLLQHHRSKTFPGHYPKPSFHPPKNLSAAKQKELSDSYASYLLAFNTARLQLEIAAMYESTQLAITSVQSQSKRLCESLTGQTSTLVDALGMSFSTEDLMHLRTLLPSVIESVVSETILSIQEKVNDKVFQDAKKTLLVASKKILRTDVQMDLPSTETTTQAFIEKKIEENVKALEKKWKYSLQISSSSKGNSEKTPNSSKSKSPSRANSKTNSKASSKTTSPAKKNKPVKPNPQKNLKEHRPASTQGNVRRNPKGGKKKNQQNRKAKD